MNNRLQPFGIAAFFVAVCLSALLFFTSSTQYSFAQTATETLLLRRATMQTFKPDSARRSASSLPIPEDAPVINAHEP